MRRKVSFVMALALFAVLWQAEVNAQAGLHNNGSNIFISPGCYVHVDGNLSSTGPISLGGKIGLTGDLEANDTAGVFVNNGKLILRGSSNQRITGSQTLNVPKLEIKNSSGIEMANDLFVGGEIKFNLGNLNLNGQTIELASDARLKSERKNHSVIGNGIVKITKDIGVPDESNPGKLGAEITSDDDLGLTTIERRHHTCVITGADSSFGYIYSIEPSYNTSLDAELTLSYPEPIGISEFDENNLILYRSLDDGLSWHQMGGYADGADNEITLSGIDHFSAWTAGFPGSVLALDLIAFGVIPLSNSIRVYFVTENETANLDHFEVERSADGINFSKLGDVPPGAVGLDVQKIYTKKDFSAPTGSWYYRLKMVDIGGDYTYSDIAFADRAAMEFVSLTSRNPVEAGGALQFSGLEGNAQLCLYDLSGRVVMYKTPVLLNTVRLNESLSPGIYFYQLTNENNGLTNGRIIIK